MYTKSDYKSEILKLIESEGYDPVRVARETFRIFCDYWDIDDDLEEKLIDIFTMEDGPEFEMTEEEFMKFLDEM